MSLLLPKEPLKNAKLPKR